MCGQNGVFHFKLGGRWELLGFAWLKMAVGDLPLIKTEYYTYNLRNIYKLSV